MSTIIAIDPSADGVTGVVIYEEEDKCLESMSIDIRDIKEKDRRFFRVLNILDELVDGWPCTIVCESYEVTGQGKHETKELVGALRAFAWIKNCEFIEQPASSGKLFSNKQVRDFIKDMKGNTESLTRHEIDAYRHLIAYILKNTHRNKKDA